MTIKNQSFKILIKVNLIIISILYIDYFIPFNIQTNEKFSSFYISEKRYVTLKSSGESYKYILECKNENQYQIGKIPDSAQSFLKNSTILINKTIFFRKVKSIENEKNETFIVSFLSTKIVIFIFLFSFMINLLNVFFNNNFLDFMLALASLPIYFLIPVYFFNY
jgi:hypothetical protein